VPPVTSLKQAILDHGPLAVGVCANAAFQAYNGGVFNNCSGGGADHAVMIVGWDDSQGASGVWVIRNSWGEDWGEDIDGNPWDADTPGGYMRIEYGCSSIGASASYIDYTGTGQGVWVDPDYTGLWESGTFWEPYDTLSEGFDNVASGGVVSIRPASIPDPLTIDWRVTLMGFDGLVVIGAP
jgi:hypothetical protein